MYQNSMNNALVNQATSAEAAEALDCLDEVAFAQAIAEADMDFQPAFVHGLLSAYCCQTDAPHAWVNALVDEIDPDNAKLTEALRYLNQVRHTLAEQLADSELSFQLLLDNRAQTLHDEVLLTREWASGYYLGVQELNLAERLGNDDLSAEFLNDLARIVAMPLPNDDDIDSASVTAAYSDHYDPNDEDDNGDDTRSDIMEIQEYCRAGAIGVFLASWR